MQYKLIQEVYMNTFLLKVGVILLAASALFAAGDVEETFILGNGAEPETLDIHLMSGVPEHRIVMGLFEGLVVPNPEDALPAPGVAESWTISDDATTYTFTLRDDAVWSDGTPVTAHQFVDSWLRILNPETAAPYAWFPAQLIAGANAYNSGEAGPEAVKVRALDNRTFQFETIGPAPYVIKALTHYSFWVAPTHAIEEYGSDWTRPENIVTNGPYELEEWSPQEQLVLRKSDTYWNQDKVKTDRVAFLPVEDENTAHTMYENAEIDWVTTVPLDQIDQVKVRNDYHNNPAFITYYYVIQTEKEPFDDVRVRKALSMAFDRDLLVDQVTRGGQVSANGIVPPITGYSQIKGNRLDVAAARRLLADAGFPNGEGFPELEILYNTSEGHKTIAEYIQQQWNENLGINVVLKNEEWKTYLATRREGTFQVARAGWAGDYYDPNTFLDLFVSGNAMNGGRYSNSEYDRLIFEALEQVENQKRLDLLAEAETLLISEDQAIIPIYYYAVNNLIDLDSWSGWYKNVMDQHPVGEVASH